MEYFNSNCKALRTCASYPLVLLLRYHRRNDGKNRRVSSFDLGRLFINCIKVFYYSRTHLIVEQRVSTAIRAWVSKLHWSSECQGKNVHMPVGRTRSSKAFLFIFLIRVANIFPRNSENVARDFLAGERCLCFQTDFQSMLMNGPVLRRWSSSFYGFIPMRAPWEECLKSQWPFSRNKTTNFFHSINNPFQSQANWPDLLGKNNYCILLLALRHHWNRDRLRIR